MKREKAKGATILTRVAFCQKCFDEKRPQKGNLFLTIGRGRQAFFVQSVSRNTPMGFTPHLIERAYSTPSHITYHSYCAMNGCDTILQLNEEIGKYNIAVTGEVQHTIPVKDWNALVQYTKDEDYFLN